MIACRSCSEPIIWAVTEKGASMPVDAQPAPYGGNIVLIWNHAKPFAPPTAHVTSKKERAERVAFGPTTFYRSHFVTCPHAKGWRR